MGKRGKKVSEKKKAKVLQLLKQGYSVSYVAFSQRISESEVRKIRSERSKTVEELIYDALNRIKELQLLQMQGIVQYLYLLSGECHAFEENILLDLAQLQRGVLAWREIWPLKKGYRLIVKKDKDDSVWLKLPARCKYPDFENIFPNLCDIPLYREICLFEQIGAKCTYFLELLRPYLREYIIDANLLEGKEPMVAQALILVNSDPHFSRELTSIDKAVTLYPSFRNGHNAPRFTLELLRREIDEWRAVASVIRNWRELLKPMVSSN